MELTPRLKRAAELIPKGSVIADVGTDHAYLPVYCILNGISPNAVAMDINEGPLKKAEENTVKYKLTDRIELRLSDGLKGLKKGEANVIVIAGMGGLLIKNILENGRDVISEDTLLIMQPMLAAEELREYLYSSGFSIENEYLASEGDKLYNIITAKVVCQDVKYTDHDIYIGRNVKTNSSELYARYIKHKSEKVRKKINGLKSARIRDEALISVAEHELAVYEKEVADYEA